MSSDQIQKQDGAVLYWDPELIIDDLRESIIKIPDHKNISNASIVVMGYDDNGDNISIKKKITKK